MRGKLREGLSNHSINFESMNRWILCVLVVRNESFYVPLKKEEEQGPIHPQRFSVLKETAVTLRHTMSRNRRNEATHSHGIDVAASLLPATEELFEQRSCRIRPLRDKLSKQH